MTGGAALLLLILGGGGGGGLRVETGSPDALCPELAQVREAVRARLGHVEGVGEWSAVYTLVHRPDGGEGDVVRLELRDPGGLLRLQRDLPRAGESCVSLAQAVVVVLDAYFRRPAEAGADRADATAPPSVAAAPAAHSPAASPPAGAAVDVAILGGWAGGPSSPALALDVRFRLVAAWAVGLQGAWLLSESEQQLGPGAATMRSYVFRAHLARRVRLSTPLEVALGPEALFALDQATWSVASERTSMLRAGWGAGLRAQLDMRLARLVAASVLAAADFAPAGWGGTFVVENAMGELFEIFPPARLRLFLGAGLSLGLF